MNEPVMGPDSNIEEWIAKTWGKTIHIMPKDEGHVMHEECPCGPRVEYLGAYHHLMTHRPIGDSFVNDVLEILSNE